MRDFVDHISHLAPSTIRDYSNIVKAVVASAINEKAEELFPRKWNEEFIDAPIIEKQNQPSTTSEGMAEILRYADGQFRVLYALLGGCGPRRAGEALGLEIGKHISEDCRTLYVRQKAKRGKIQPNLKTKHGERDTDLCTPLAAMLRDFIGSRTSGLLFCTSTGKQLLQSNTLQDSLHPILKKIEHERVGSTSFGGSASRSSRRRSARRPYNTSGRDTHQRMSPNATRNCSNSVIGDSSGLRG